MPYNVILVDDELQDGLVALASTMAINITQYYSFEEAFEELRNNFLAWDAIILDAHCSLKKNDSASDHFLNTAIPTLGTIFSQKGKELPWYIYSAGTTRILNFDEVVRNALTFNNRNSHINDWGELIYLKVSRSQKEMLDNVKAAVDLCRDIVNQHHPSLLVAMKAANMGNHHEAIHDILRAHYDQTATDVPNGFLHLRQILETMMRDACTIGMLPDDFFKDDEIVDLSAASRYLAGRNTSDTLRIRSSKAFIPEWVANLFQSVIHVCGIAIHSTSTQAAAPPANVLFGYAILMVDAICWFAQQYERTINDAQTIQDNKNCCLRLKDAENVFLNKDVIAQSDGNISFVGNILLSRKVKAGDTVRMRQITFNSDDNRDIYPFFGKC